MSRCNRFAHLPKMLLIFCDGGFANRVGSLVSGMSLADLLGLDYLVLWPPNNRCGARFESLFLSHCLALQVRLPELVPYAAGLQVWLHENDYGFAAPVHRVRDLGLEEIRSLANNGDQRPILFAENTFLPWLPATNVDRALNRLNFHPKIVAAAQRVLDGRMVGSFFGIHLRGTDFMPPPPVEQMLEVIIANPDFDFFVCSDEDAIEQRFAQHPNVFTHRKSAHVEKLTRSGAWRSNILDSDGLPYTSNIDRTGESVIQACTDLILLGASTPIKTSHSSFLALAERLRDCGFIARHLNTLSNPVS